MCVCVCVSRPITGHTISTQIQSRNEGRLTSNVHVVEKCTEETNATWNSRAREVLSNATLLRQSGFKLTHCDRPPVSFFGTDFFWPCHTGNPYFDQIPGETDVLIAHNPAKGCADGGKGCPALLDAVVKLQPELVTG